MISHSKPPSFQYADDTLHKRKCQQNIDDTIVLQVEFLYQRTHSDPCERCKAAECGNKQLAITSAVSEV